MTDGRTRSTNATSSTAIAGASTATFFDVLKGEISGGNPVSDSMADTRLGRFANIEGATASTRPNMNELRMPLAAEPGNPATRGIATNHVAISIASAWKTAPITESIINDDLSCIRSRNDDPRDPPTKLPIATRRMMIPNASRNRMATEFVSCMTKGAKAAPHTSPAITPMVERTEAKAPCRQPA